MEAISVVAVLTFGFAAANLGFHMGAERFIRRSETPTLPGPKMALEHPVPQRPIFNGNSAVQSGERNTRHKAGDLQLHDARGPACRSTPATATVVQGLICGCSDEY